MSDPTPSTEIYDHAAGLFAGGVCRDLAAALDGGPVACLQLRAKDVDDDATRAAAAAILPVAHARGVPVLMNDRPDSPPRPAATACTSARKTAPMRRHACSAPKR